MIDKLEMFLALARERHFGRAAASCGVTQPTLSAALRQLESQLGVQLVARGARFQGLTADGERVLVWARRIVADSRQMQAEVSARRRGLTGLLRLGVIPTALPMVPRLVTPLLDRHPNMRLRVLSRTSVEILAELDALELDAGITYLDNEPLGRVVSVPLHVESYRLLLRADHPRAVALQGRADGTGGVALGWADLAGLRLCLLTPTMQNRRILDQRLAQAGVALDPPLETNSLLTLIAHVVAGGWATVITAEAATLVAGQAELLALPITEDPGRGHGVGLIVPDRDPLPPAVAALVETARRL
jgi:DNA-binding transcriptional LysR family regulator